MVNTNFDEGWNDMQKGIMKLKRILEGLPETPFSSEEYIAHYTTIYNMCTNKPHDYSQQLYDKYKEAFEEYISSTVLPSLREKHDEFMLRELVKRWANHKVMLRFLSHFFRHLDHYFIPRRSLPTLKEVGLTRFRDLIYNELKDNAKDVIITLCVECLKKQRDRVSHYLHSSSESKLLEKVQHELLVVFATELLEKENSGCHALLKDDKVDDLSRMYRLYHKIPKGMQSVANVFKQHITAEGTVLVQQAEDAAMNHAGHAMQEPVLIRKIIELHDKCMEYVADCFHNHTLFHKAVKEAFEIFCNKTVGGSSSSELLATFCDNILKNGGGDKMGDEAIEETLEKVVKLIACISDKDLFVEFYRKKLARRLFFDRSANDDHERSILTKLKQQCGGQFTSKMEGMSLFSPLASWFWPIYKSSDLNLPLEMVKCVEVFKGFYETKTKHRKLTWIYSLGQCNVNGKFEQKTIELFVSTYQAATLLLFNSSDRLSYSEIMTQLNLTHDGLVRLLHSLSCAKYKILIKEPNTKTISQNDYFEFNSKFTDRMRRIKIPLPPVDERKKIVEDVDKDRRYAIDAAIVRIMKSRKVLGHQQLVSECVEQLSRMFKPDIKAIKKCLEDLISRDYLERDKENPITISFTYKHTFMLTVQ
ncbi:hypothetical protein Q3G72_021237 [Acer saccharum]|nr:hypothetical protein Q3G72_021237 [Acer saccharum]